MGDDDEKPSEETAPLPLKKRPVGRPGNKGKGKKKRYRTVIALSDSSDWVDSEEERRRRSSRKRKAPPSPYGARKSPRKALRSRAARDLSESSEDEVIIQNTQAKRKTKKKGKV